MIINISDIRIRVDGNRKPLEKHPYYLALHHNDEKIYTRCVNQKINQKIKESASWDGFLHLVEVIDKEGFIFNSKDPLILKYKHNHWMASHGRHRLCILRYIYGENCELQIKTIRKNVSMIIDVHSNRSVHSDRS